MAKEDSKSLPDADSELLTAYLDGELSDAQCAAVEKRLSEDADFHNLMRELQNAWDMLDSLPLVQPNSQFVRTTVEMAIAGENQSAGPLSKNLPNLPNILKGLMLLLVPATVFGLSYFVQRESIEQPERELVLDLPLIENHDRYKSVVNVNDSAAEGIEFLKSIYARGLFREVDDLFPVDTREDSLNDLAPTSAPPDPQRLKDRSDRLSRMTDQQRAELFAKKDKFESLPKAHQEALREFHNLLAEEPARRKLVDVLSSYYDWLKILGMSRQANLRDLPLKQRLREIGRITRQQAQDAFGTIGSTKLPLDDAVLFYKWYDISIRYYVPEIRERTGEVLTRLNDARGLPTSERVIDRVKSGPIEQLVEFLMLHDREHFGKILCDNSMARNIGLDYLREIVSDKTRSIIDEPDFTEEDRRELILKWIETANRARFPIKDSELKSFYAELTLEQRDQLENFDPEQWHDALTRMYWEKNIGQRDTPADDGEFQKFLRQLGIEAGFESEEDSL